MEPKEAVAALSALAHEPRLSVFRMLVTAGREGIAATTEAASAVAGAPTNAAPAAKDKDAEKGEKK